MKSIYNEISKIESSNQKAALCVIYNTKGSTPRKTGAKMLVHEDGSIFGTIGGGPLEKKVIEDALSVIKKNEPATFSHVLGEDHGMCCGGAVEIYIEPIMNRIKLYIFGAGHIGKVLAKFAKELDFNVTLIDERDDIFSPSAGVDWSAGYTIVQKKHDSAFKELTFDENTFTAIVTHSHDLDREIVAYCAKQPYAYLGMIGSKRKVDVNKKAFIAGKILTEDEMKDIDWPIGIDISCQTPEEIAVSILAKIIDVRAKINIK